MPIRIEGLAVAVVCFAVGFGIHRLMVLAGREAR